MFKHVLIPTDGSALSRKAAKAGIAFAKSTGAKVTIYHAIEVFQPYLVGEGVALDASTFKTFVERAREQGEKVVAEVVKAAKAAGVRSETYLSKPATPYQGIIDAAKKQKCDAIFMASHGRGELASLLLGSVTVKVLAHSKVPVVVYR
jgi:nucleotide-binding universal stress UspA family protein